MKKVKSSIISNIKSSQWAGYKYKLEELSILPVMDDAGLNLAVSLFDIYLLENLVDAYYDYFVYSLDYESNSSEISNFSFDSYWDTLDELDSTQDIQVFFNDLNLEEYMVSVELLDSVLFEEIDEDYIIQVYYTLLIWGPLELVYHSLTKSTWTSYSLRRADILQTLFFSSIFKIYIYFANLYDVQNYIINRNFGYFIFNKLTYKLIYYKSKHLNVLYSGLFEFMSKSWIYYLVYTLYFLISLVSFVLLYNLALLQYIFRIMLYWITRKVLSGTFYLKWDFYICILHNISQVHETNPY